MNKFFASVKKNGVETAILPLQVLKAVAGLTSVPALGSATDIMLSILDKAYQTQQNTGTALEIANLCLRAHSTLSQHLQSVEITPALLNSIRQFEMDLHDAQESVEKYEQKMWIGRLLYSKTNNDDLQRLEKRVNNTLSLFQIEKLLSLEEINVKIHACVQRLEQNIAGNSTSLQRIEQNTAGNNTSLQCIEQSIVLLKNCSELTPRPDGVLVDIVPRSLLTPCEEITNGPGYSLQSAEMRGRTVAIKVFTGSKAKTMWEVGTKLDATILHPNLSHLIGTSSLDEHGPPFLVYDLNIQNRVEGAILTWMAQDVNEIMYKCARLVHGVSSALINLSAEGHLLSLSAKSFDILWDSRGRVVLSIRPETVSSSTALASLEGDGIRPLRVMDDICANIFRSVNQIRYDDDPFHPLGKVSSLATSSSPSSNTTETTPRREILWHRADVSGSNTDLDTISQQYGSFANRHTESCRHVPRFNVVDGPAYRPCAGYRREELNLTHHVMYNNVLVHSASSVVDVCVTCGKPPIIPPFVKEVTREVVCDFCQKGSPHWKQRLEDRRKIRHIVEWRCWDCGEIVGSKGNYFHHRQFTCPIRHPRNL
ncbi:hypothetical protein IW261DRAFT_1497916 [Armillaria novae-zelandiae]|uniref:Protein kinase domain-containing protein n=1 Tax=Armillaria novae-zelandiae TaxID=153914 RepID=A0AA39NZV0_9AGAR|nr:hypothetical protein IW261DRAFT_1497916 [Armillaria novae-zelandiae]